MHHNHLLELCSAFQLSPPIEPLATIIPEHLWQLTTEQGIFAIKLLASNQQEKWRNFTQGQRIAQALGDKGIPVNMALLLKESSRHTALLQIDESQFTVYPWCAGEILSFNPAPIEKAKIIGALLARIHTINLQAKDIIPANAKIRIIQPAAWQEFNGIENASPEINDWCTLYYEALNKLDKNCVLSHGDLTQSNVIWQNNSPTIIDWDSAGWIHPQIELLGVALNWSGINVGEIDQAVFNAVIDAYQTTGGTVKLNQTVLHASLGSWLAWLGFNTGKPEFTQTKEVIRRILTLFMPNLNSKPDFQ